MAKGTKAHVAKAKLAYKKYLATHKKWTTAGSAGTEPKMSDLALSGKHGGEVEGSTPKEELAKNKPKDIM